MDSLQSDTSQAKRPIKNLFKSKSPPLKRTKIAPNQQTLNFFTREKRSNSTLGLASDSDLNKKTATDSTQKKAGFQLPARSLSSLSQLNRKHEIINDDDDDDDDLVELESRKVTQNSMPMGLLSRSTKPFESNFHGVDDAEIFNERKVVNNLKNSQPIGSVKSLMGSTSTDSSINRAYAGPVFSSSSPTVQNQNQNLLSAIQNTGRQNNQTTFKKSTSSRLTPWDSMKHIANKKNPRVKEGKVRSFEYDTASSDFELSDEQKTVIDLVVKDGISLFFTGSAGTGKSVLLRELVKRLAMKHGAKAVGITASTGFAACNIGGITINRFSGVGIAEKKAEELLSMVKRKTDIKDQWKRTKVLIIDEISMLDGNFFDKLEYVARRIRSDPRPFGGVQLVLTGDFFQLPPVPSKNGPPQKFCFESETWSKVIRKTILLKKVFRQKDEAFASLLNKLRIADVDHEVESEFMSLSRPVEYEDGISPTELFPTRFEVENSNRRILASLEGQEREYNATDIGMPNMLYLLENTMASKKLVLKEGANVMYLKNKDETLVNGSVGTVITFLPKPSFDTLRAKFNLSNVPLGDSAIENLKQLSRCCGATDVPKEVVAFSYKSVLGKEEFLKIAIQITKDTYSEVLPIVKFGNSRVECIEREDFKVGGERDRDDLLRKQIPLLLSWALSIHKSQGQTLDRVKVDLTKVFEAGQVYTALSRATSRDRLQVINFNKNKIVAHSRVKQFYDQLQNSQSS